MSAEGWREASSLDGRLSASPCEDGTLLTLAPMNSVFLGLTAGPWEQLTATLDPGFAERGEAERLTALSSLAQMQALTLGARAALDRRGALVVVSDRLTEALTPQRRLAWVMSVQVVANGMLSLLAASEAAGGPIGHDEAQALLTRRPS